MKNLKNSQIAMSNFPYFRYSLNYTLDSLEKIGAGPIEFYACDPHFYVDDNGLGQIRALKQKLKDHGLYAINWCPEQVKYAINIASPNSYCRKRSIEYYVKSIQFANELECPSVQFFAGWNMLDRSYNDTWKYSVDSLAYLADIAHGYGINITIEAADPLTTVLTSTKRIKQMLNEVNSQNLHGMIDIYCLKMCEETIDDALENLKGEVYHVHFSDGQYDGLSAHVIPGTGVLDMDYILKRLDEYGYKGYLSLELMTPYERIPEKAMQQSVAWMKQKIGK